MQNITVWRSCRPNLLALTVWSCVHDTAIKSGNHGHHVSSANRFVLFSPTGDRGRVGDMGLKGFQGVRGPPGDIGDIGPNGTAGEKGEEGEKGIKGMQGDVGEDGELGPVGRRGPQGKLGGKQVCVSLDMLPLSTSCPELV